MSKMFPKAVNDYYIGLLYGDGYYQEDEGIYFFSTTQKEIANVVERKLEEKQIQYRRYNRTHSNSEKQDKWEILEIIEITDKEFIDYLSVKKMLSDEASDRMKCNSSFIRGYLETKGTFFYFQQRGNDAWRVALSGQEDDLQILHDYLCNEQGINCSQMSQRKEREDLNIISSSYRFAIQNRSGIAKFVEFIKNDYELSQMLKEKINAFEHWHQSKPFNMVKQYKNYRTATLFMAKQMNIDLHGKRGGGGKAHVRPVYLWDEDQAVQEFAGWQGAYEWAKEKFQNDFGLNPPIVTE